MPKKRKPKATRVRTQRWWGVFLAVSGTPVILSRHRKVSQKYVSNFCHYATVRPVTITWHEPRGE